MRAIAWVVVLATALTASCGPRRPQPMTAFDGRLSDWSREILADSPEMASYAGVSEDEAGGAFDNRLDDRSAIAAEARRRLAAHGPNRLPEKTGPGPNRRRCGG